MRYSLDFYNQIEDKIARIYIYNTSKSDYFELIKFLNNQKVDFKKYNEEVNKYNSIEIELIKNLWDKNEIIDFFAILYLETLQIRVYFNTVLMIECDVDLRYLKTEKQHIELMDFLKKLAVIIDKTVFLENDFPLDESKRVLLKILPNN
ncbi:MAG: hypothetical protein H6604_03210 [Flavobacteriales bacterium]|nr:hypothetical protein [Flavobacteriales bacterium]